MRLNNMLQIEIEERDGIEPAFALRGEIVSSCAGELIDRWNEYKLLRDGRACIVDVSLVGVIDQDGELAIRRLASDGARFLANGPMMDRVIQLVCDERKHARREGRREFRSIIFCC
jgi:hypothetical protein